MGDGLLKEDCPDHRIINCAFKLHEENLDKQLVLVSKDTNMRLKARSLGIMAEDYTTDTIEDVNHIYPGNRLIENVSSEEIDMIYNADGVDFKNLESIQKPVPNENYILRNGQKSVLAYFDPFEKKITQINNLNAYGILNILNVLPNRVIFSIFKNSSSSKFCRT